MSQNINNNNNNLVSSDSDNNTSLTTNSLRKKKIPLSPITEINTPLLDESNRTDYFDAAANNNHNNNSSNNSEKLTEGVAENSENSLKQRSNNLKYLSKSMESMHSSQMPVEKLPLTKNVRVDKIIKRLSVERLSPPPLAVLQAGGFSYTNPQLSPKSPTTTTLPGHTNDNKKSPALDEINNDTNNSIKNNSNSNIVYTQVVCNENAESKTIQNNETVHNTLLKTSRKSAASPTNLITNVYKNNNEQSRNDRNDFPNIATDERNSKRHQAEDFGRDEFDNIASTNEEEPIIKANIRKHIPRYSSNSNIDNLGNNNHINSYNHQQNYYLDSEFDRLNEMRETDNANGMDATLSSRREILESRIKSRIGGLHHINNDNNHTRSNHPPTTAKRTYNKHGSNEFINNRFSPERKHLNNKSSSPPYIQKYEQKTTTYLDDGSMRKSTYTQKFNDKYTDSGNETDIVVRNNHNNRNRYSSRFNIGRKWNYEDDIIECELFLMKERKHTEETYPYQLVRTYVHRQHTNNDDDYDIEKDKKNIIKEWKHNKKMTREFLKSQTKKKSGLEKVKELFKLKSNKNNDENELRARYREYSPEIEPPPQKSTSAQPNIVNRRRLSTPTSSPMITNRSKSLPPKAVINRNASTLRKEKQQQNNNNSQQKFNWFASLERLSRKKSRDLSSNPPTIDRRSSSSITRAKSSSMKNISVSNGSNKNLRFFGDTDLDETERRKTPYYDETREKSSSLQNLNSARRMRQSKSVSRSRAELINIAESTSDEAGEKSTVRSRPVSPSINNYLPPPRPPKSTKLVRSVSTLPRPMPRKSIGQENYEHESYYQHKRDSNLESDSNFSTSRRLRNSLSVSRENLHRDRFDSDASQRSVVYLHASVVGDIPQTNGRKLSGKNSVKTAYNEEQPIVRTVNSTLSMDAPWKPKFISDGYEINYSNDQKDVANRRKFRSKSATREKSKWDREAHKRI